MFAKLIKKNSFSKNEHLSKKKSIEIIFLIFGRGVLQVFLQSYLLPFA